MKTVLKICTALLLMMAALPVMAVCTPTLTPTSVSLGTQSSFNVNATSYSVQDTLNVSCGTSLLSILGNDYITVTNSAATASASGRATLVSGSDAIPLRVYACTTSACAATTELTLGGTGASYANSTLLAVNLGSSTNTGNFSIPLIISTVTGATVAAGTYTVSLSITVAWHFCTGGIGLGSGCLLGTIQQGSQTLTLPVTMIVTSDCTTLTTQPIAFGSAPLVSVFTTFSGNITVVCTKNSTYTVGITNGLHSVGTQRYMVNGSNSSVFLAYQIYKGATTTYWGPTGTDRQSSTAVTANSDFITRVFPFTAQILTSQNTPVAGSYTDTVSVDVSF